MQNKYDIIIVGMGPSSIFCAYELIKKGYKDRILLIEKGHKIEDRICPITKNSKCLKCKPICNIIGGFSGAGAFSDGKLLQYHLASCNKNSKDIYIGGKENSYIKDFYSKKEIEEYLKYTDSIYSEFGSENKIEGLDNNKRINELQEKAIENNLKLIDVPIRHLGTEESHKLYKKLQDYLSNHLDMLFETEVVDLIIDNNEIRGVTTNKGSYYSNKVILAVGVDGSQWLEGLCKKYNIKTRNGFMDIGVRYEIPNKVMKEINELMYEGKFIGNHTPYNDKVRTYCQNPGGFVTAETYDNGCTLVNGHAYKNKKSDNTNLALLVSYKFDEPFNSPIEYGFNIAKKVNLLTGGTVIVQRLGDLLEGVPSTVEKINNNSIKPTMDSAVPGDLSLGLDYRTMTNIIEFIKSINNVIPGFSNKDNLIYGPEIKPYGNEVIIDKNFQTSVKNLYSIGTGGGLTIGLMMASASGLMMAHRLIGGEKNE